MGGRVIVEAILTLYKMKEAMIEELEEAHRLAIADVSQVPPKKSWFPSSKATSEKITKSAKETLNIPEGVSLSDFDNLV